MAETKSPLPPNPLSTTSPTVTDKDALLVRLDTLLEQYLHTLDTYEKLTQQLSKHLSSAFFSLAQANFHNRTGVHYGQDRYDERVQATRKIIVSEAQGEGGIRYSSASTVAPTKARTGASTGAEKDDQPEEDEAKEEPEESAEFRPESPKVGFVEENQSDSDPALEESEGPKSTGADPIRMFGILVPPALRSAQASFSDAVDGPVVGLAAVTGELRALEREIGRVRKGIRRA